jgi:NAD(P)-dependent dehydrogenase (short-subunit alcohol dehydrogenase family)
LDVTDPASIAAARDYIANVIGRLDILINNAGIAQMLSRRRASATPLEVVRQTFDVNVFGLIAVTNAVLPLLARAPAGRIVNVSSMLGSVALVAEGKIGFGRSPDDMVMAYSVSKSAVTSITVQYATELRDTAIKVNAVCPGYTATDMTGRQGRPVADGAQIIVDMALLPNDGVTGAYVNDTGPIPW